jgi:hypothetical protein
MKKLPWLTAILVMSSVAWPQTPNNPAGNQAGKQTFRDIIEKAKTASPDAAANLMLMRHLVTQDPQTGSAFFKSRVEPVKNQAWIAMRDYVAIQLSADLITARGTHPQAAKDVARGLSDLIGWSDNTVQGFVAAEIKDIPAKRPYEDFVGTVYQGIDKLVRNSADSDWPPSAPVAEKSADTQALEGVSPKAMKDLSITRGLVKQPPTKSGNAAVDQGIGDAKKRAVDSLTGWVGMELYADLLVARENESKNFEGALRVISGSKYATSKAAIDKAFAEYEPPDPVLGDVTLKTWSWLAPQVHSTVVRLAGTASD